MRAARARIAEEGETDTVVAVPRSCRVEAVIAKRAQWDVAVIARTRVKSSDAAISLGPPE
jgi:hypothetical protein